MSTKGKELKLADEKPKSPGLHVVQKVLSGETYLVISDSAVQPEDEFQSLYYTSGASSNVVMAPPYDPSQLASFVTHNNILNQCVEAMEVNIDGTGFTIEAVDEDTKLDEAEKARLTEFFNEPYPGQSFVTIRRSLRRMVESAGYGVLEVLQNMDGDVLGLRNMDTLLMRFIKLDEAVMVEKAITRDGKEATIQMMDRERRFVQRLGNKFYYYREYGSTRECNKHDGRWESDTYKVPTEDRASQLIVFGVIPDARSPYFVPRWINNLPSVIGSRKAEEQNLEYFDAGGLPPAIIFIQGGTLASGVSDQLKTYLSGKNKNKNRAVVVEAQSASGSMDSAGQVKVTVERFGSIQANDSMYEKYDKNAEEHVRVAFRLPALFLGRTSDYNYATAVVAYMVAEEQVFQPERSEFDEVINKTIVRALGCKTARFQSKPITLKNVDSQIAALTMVKDNVEGEGFVDEVNKIAGVNLTYKEPEDPVLLAKRMQDAVGAPVPGKPGAPADKKAPVDDKKGKVVSITSGGGKTPKKATEIIDLAMQYGQMRGLLESNFEMSEAEKADVTQRVAELSESELSDFNQMVSAYVFSTADADLVSLVHNGHDH